MCWSRQLDGPESILIDQSMKKEIRSISVSHSYHFSSMVCADIAGKTAQNTKSQNLGSELKLVTETEGKKKEKTYRA